LGSGNNDENALTLPDGTVVEEVNEGGDPNNPATCAIAAASKSYVGCDFWPTQTTNKVHEEFSFAVVVANGGTSPAQVTVQGGALAMATAYTVEPQGLTVIELPWVSELKGTTWINTATSMGRTDATTRQVPGGAYHLTSDIPVTAWQFNPLDFAIPNFADCKTNFAQPDCYSVSNDATILIPSTAMTGNYRLHGFPAENGGGTGSMAGGFAITATEADTTVEVQFGLECETGVNDPDNQTGDCVTGVDGQVKLAGDVEELTLNAGDVVHYIGARGPGFGLVNADLSGSLVKANKNVQVISFNPLTQSDKDTGYADHIEEIVLPAEVLGYDYVVPVPTSPNGAVKGGHIVRMVGNFENTELTYEDKPMGAPDTLGIGETKQFRTDKPFRVTSSSDKPFVVSSIMLGSLAQGEGAGCASKGFPCSGDPAMSIEVTPEQFRTTYTFLAPLTYDSNYADILIPDGATVTLDGNAVTPTEAVVAGYQLARVPLASKLSNPNNENGSHRLESDLPIGLQVMGFGHATSYYYPGGLDLEIISEVPEISIVVR
ncbi:MAG: IgGFc-binding protein, partial [Polyangiaceae bacterium]|nr:IgGFc-binding protein [Polyangiaceae bacterium]